MPDSFLDAVTQIVGANHVLLDDDLRAGYERDWTGRYVGTSVAVVRPGSTSEVSDVLSRCSDFDVTVIPQAGNTGLVGGGVPRVFDGSLRRSIVLSMRRFDQAGVVDVDVRQVTVGAGVTLAQWRGHARAVGLDTPVDFAARDIATVGGAIATNAGGSRVLRFGTMRSHVVGVEAVLANGEVVGSLTGLPKETAGLHWPSLIAGSEGTLAVLTRARMRLVPWYRSTTTAFVSTASVAAAVSLLGRLRRGVPSLDAVELIQPSAMKLVAGHLGERPPVTAPDDGTYLMIECADHTDPNDQLLTVLATAPEVLDSALTSETSRREHLVQFRDRITEAIAAASTTIGTPTFKLDVAVPVASLQPLLDVARAAAAADGCELIAFGHLAEGNVHLNHLGATDPDRIAATVLPGVASLGGTISAEHGIGVAKVPWLPLIRTRGELDAQAGIKRALDPLRILNPGVLEVPAQVP